MVICVDVLDESAVIAACQIPLGRYRTSPCRNVRFFHVHISSTSLSSMMTMSFDPVVVVVVVVVIDDDVATVIVSTLGYATSHRFSPWI
jgi:hypothetical protein